MNPFKLFSAHDLLVFAGSICAAWGLWLIHPPTCLIVVGLGMAAVGVMLGRPRK
jgi:hypothetical protein